jgi:hypothetical protein
MLADTGHDERRGIEEMYTSSTHTSDLKVESRVRKPVDDIIAAGWSRSRIGAALLRLHSEWDGCEKPQKATLETIELYTKLHAENRWKKAPGVYLRIVHKKDHLAAKAEADRWYLHELGLLFQKLKSLQDVRAQLILWCGRVGMSGGVHKVAAIVSWWLDPTCPTCDGQKWELIPGTGRQSNKTCKFCHGSGEAYLPHGHDGRKMLRFINDCLQAARASMRGRFNHQQP